MASFLKIDIQIAKYLGSSLKAAPPPTYLDHSTSSKALNLQWLHSSKWMFIVQSAWEALSRQQTYHLHTYLDHSASSKAPNCNGFIPQN
jgi:hypothetical protein